MLKEQRKEELLKEQWKDIMSNVKGSQDSSLPQVAEKDLDQSHDENLPVPSGTKGYHGRNEETRAQEGSKQGSVCEKEVPLSGIYVYAQRKSNGPQVAEKDFGQSHAANLPVPSGTKGYHERIEEAGAPKVAEPGFLCAREMSESGIYVKSRRDRAVPQDLDLSHNRNLRPSPDAMGHQGINEVRRARTVSNQYHRANTGAKGRKEKKNPSKNQRKSKKSRGKHFEYIKSRSQRPVLKKRRQSRLSQTGSAHSEKRSRNQSQATHP